jgi:hypothetical protein
MAPDAALAIALVATGDDAAARATLQTIDAGAYPVEAGLVHAAMGDRATAYELFERPIPAGFGAAMLFHHHFRDVWKTLDDQSRLDRLAASIARSWHADPRDRRSVSRPRTRGR